MHAAHECTGAGTVYMQHTSVRVLEHDNAELARAADDLKHRLQECALQEHEGMRLLAEARARESVAAQRLADECARVHTLELLRLTGALLHMHAP